MNNISDLGLTIHSSSGFNTFYTVTKQCPIKWEFGEINVPVGYITNLASIPPFFRNILPPTGKYGCASVAHDYLFDTYGLDYTYDIHETNLIFKRIMEYDKVKPWKVWVMYRAVEIANKDYPK